jgi:hypothetical protein
MKRFKVKVQGAGALLMHKYPVPATTEDAGNSVKPVKTGPPKPEDEAEAGAWRLDPNAGEEKGQLCLHGEHFFQSMVLAASGFQVKGQGKKTYKDAVKGIVFVEPEYIGLTDNAGKALFTYAIDIRPARIKAARINRCRPLLKEWAAEFDIVVTDEKAVPKDVINAILVLAGQTKGVGDYRPRFGRFIVERFEEVTG